MALERLEGRELLAFSPLGFSLPELSISGYESNAASWGGLLTVTVNAQNLGASTITEPTNWAPGAPSTADAPASNVSVLISRVPHPTSLGQVVDIGTVSLPTIKQNSLTQVTQTLTLPSQPAGFPGDGGKVYVFFTSSPVVSPKNLVRGTPVLITAPLPDLAVTDLDVPATMQPGDTIAPVIRIANVGSTATANQSSFTVELVASTQPRLNAGSSVVASYTVSNIPGLSQTSSGSLSLGDVNLDPQANILTITGSPVTLPTSPRTYFLGVVVDPTGSLTQLSSLAGVRSSSNTLTQVRKVGPPVPGLSPAGVLYPGGGANNQQFPFPPNITPSSTSSTTLFQTGINTGTTTLA